MSAQNILHDYITIISEKFKTKNKVTDDKKNKIKYSESNSYFCKRNKELNSISSQTLCNRIILFIHILKNRQLRHWNQIHF